MQFRQFLQGIWAIGLSVILACIFVIFVPPSPDILDVLLLANFAGGIVILTAVLFVRKPNYFCTFSIIWSATALFRLLLGVATAYLILSHTTTHGMNAAGIVVRNYSESYGIIVGTIIVFIAFVIATKNITRIQEIAAAHLLNAIPGRQMAVDADHCSGMIDEHEAKRRHEELVRLKNFFNVMFDSGEFVRRECIVGMAIIIVTVFGGLAVGVIGQGIPLTEAFGLFSRLALGASLAIQIPALLVSTATVFLFGRSYLDNTFTRRKFAVLFLIAFFISILAPASLLPTPLMLIVASSIGWALAVTCRNMVQKNIEARQEQVESGRNGVSDEPIENHRRVDPITIEIGMDLIPLADPSKGGDLLERIRRARKDVAAEIGIVLPRIRIRDSFNLDATQYCIKIAEETVVTSLVYPDLCPVIPFDNVTKIIQGIETTDLAYGISVLWIDEATRHQVEIFGYTVVEPAAVITMHLLAVIRKHADQFLTEAMTQDLLDSLRKTSTTNKR